MQRLWELAHALDVRSKDMAKTIGVTSPQRLVVRIIGQVPEATASTIAHTLSMHPSTLTGVLTRLERHGLITRTPDVEDRRRVRFRLTAEGKRIDRERKGTVEAAVRRTLQRTTANQVDGTLALIAILVEELAR